MQNLKSLLKNGMLVQTANGNIYHYLEVSKDVCGWPIDINILLHQSSDSLQNEVIDLIYYNNNLEYEDSFKGRQPEFDIMAIYTSNTPFTLLDNDLEYYKEYWKREFISEQDICSIEKLYELPPNAWRVFRNNKK